MRPDFLRGNKDLLKLPKTAFLCSRNIPASAVLKCYDWAIEQRDNGVCVISCFQSKIEKDVLHYLIQGSQPVIIVLARGMKKRFEPKILDALSQERLLMLTPFDDNVKHVTAETAEQRNRLMIEMSNEVIFGHISEGGNLAKLLEEYEGKKPMKIL